MTAFPRYLRPNLLYKMITIKGGDKITNMSKYGGKLASFNNNNYNITDGTDSMMMVIVVLSPI